MFGQHKLLIAALLTLSWLGKEAALVSKQFGCFSNLCRNLHVHQQVPRHDKADVTNLEGAFHQVLPARLLRHPS